MEDGIIGRLTPGAGTLKATIPINLGVSGRNVSLHDRSFKVSSAKRAPAKNSSFPERVPKAPRRKREDPKRKPSRSAFNLPVKCLPGAEFEGDGGRERCSSSCSSFRPRHVWPLHGENKTLIQIREAEQVSDFQRILSSNAILSGTARSLASPLSAEMFGDAPVNRAGAKRPLSSYSVWNVNETYNYLFQRHLDSLQQVLSRKFSVETERANSNSVSIREERLYEELYNLSEYYRDDEAPAELIAEKSQVSPANNFNVNLSGLIGADDGRVADDNRVWSVGSFDSHGPIDMSTIGESEEGGHMGDLEETLCGLRLDKGDVPKITLSGCLDGAAAPGRTQPGGRRLEKSFTLTVPSVDCDVESRPPTAE